MQLWSSFSRTKTGYFIWFFQEGTPTYQFLIPDLLDFSRGKKFKKSHEFEGGNWIPHYSLDWVNPMMTYMWLVTGLRSIVSFLWDFKGKILCFAVGCLFKFRRLALLFSVNTMCVFWILGFWAQCLWYTISKVVFCISISVFWVLNYPQFHLWTQNINFCGKGSSNQSEPSTIISKFTSSVDTLFT